jgi:MFS family permease
MAQVSLTLLALFQGCAMFVAASGLLSSSISLQAGDTGLSANVIGLIMAAYFLGFIAGTYLCPRVISVAGHIRAFSVFAAIAAAAAIAHALLADMFVWAGLRLVTGVCLAGLFMVVESWLNEQTANSVRGRVFAVYQIISLASIAAGQWLLLLRPADMSAPFLVCGMLFALALVPIALARVTEPAPVARVRLDLRHLWSVSPLGVLGAFTAAVANSVFFALGPVFGTGTGMTLPQLALFMSIVIMGGVLLQWPIGHLSDRFDRRRIILAASVSATALAACVTATTAQLTASFYLSTFLYGGFTFSIYPLCVAHSNDHAHSRDFMRTASGLLLVYGAGATLGPALAGLVMGSLGSGAFFKFLMVTHGCMSVFILYRIAMRPRTPSNQQERFVMLNRTSQSALRMLPAVAPKADDGSSQAPSPGEGALDDTGRCTTASRDRVSR